MRSGLNTTLEIAPSEARREMTEGVDLVDIRTAEERVTGTVSGALEMTAEQVRRRFGKDPGWRVNLICAGGARSLVLTATLRRAGIEGARSVAGGLDRWQSMGLPVERAEQVPQEHAERFARHLVLPQVGPKGQARLQSARVLLAGLGGLNSPVALYLAAAGVGTLGLVDFDRVERSNLQRQVLYGDEDVGHPKTAAARRRLQQVNPELRCDVIDERINSGNAEWLVSGWDVVVDGTDNLRARHALNAACVAAGIPLVFGAVARFQGQVSVFWPASEPGEAPCLNCLIPESGTESDPPSCAEAGVLGVVPGIVGTLQAAEALKILLKTGEPLVGSLLVIDALTMDFRRMKVRPDPACPVCG